MYVYVRIRELVVLAPIGTITTEIEEGRDLISTFRLLARHKATCKYLSGCVSMWVDSVRTSFGVTV